MIILAKKTSIQGIGDENDNTNVFLKSLLPSIPGVFCFFFFCVLYYGKALDNYQRKKNGFQSHPARIKITGPSDCEKLFFLRYSFLNNITDFEKKIIF